MSHVFSLKLLTFQVKKYLVSALFWSEIKQEILSRYFFFTLKLRLDLIIDFKEMHQIGKKKNICLNCSSNVVYGMVLVYK